MSGHSKWSKIKRQKSVQDAKRGNIFTKLGNAIAIAAREGGDDPDTNFKLRLAIEKAKQANMPKQNIERAINRGSGKTNGGVLEKLTYEGFGPGKAGVIVEVVTDNKNRSVANLKHIFSKNGGELTDNGSIMWMFTRKGVIVCENKTKLSEDEELMLIELGVDDWEVSDNGLIVYTAANNLQKTVNALKEKAFIINSAELEYIPNKTQPPEDAKKWEMFINALEEDDDVNNYYSNVEY